MAAGAAQAERVPGVEDLQVCLGNATTEGTRRSSMKQPANSVSAWVIPLQNGQRPDTTTPPSTDLAVPRGAHTPAATPRPSPNISSRLDAGR